MTIARYGKLISAGLMLASLSFAPAFAQDSTAPTTTPPAVQTAPATPSPTPTQTDNGQSAQSTSEADKPSGPIADTDVFGYDITMGTSKLTAEQITSAKNICRDNVTIDPVRYSSNVKAFCDQLK
jgi:hypothetical protein